MALNPAPAPSLDIGVQSYCFRHFKDNQKVAQLTRAIGVDKLEICGVHADFDKPDSFKKIVDIYAAAGVKIVSLGVQTFTGDRARERNWFQCAKAAGARHISAHFTAATFQTAVPIAVELCEEFGMRIGIHNHGGYNFGGSPDVLDVLLKLGGKPIGLNLDTAWCIQIGPWAGDPVKWIREKFPGRIYAVHYKDFVFDKNAQWNDVVIGTGNLDLPGVVRALNDTGFDGVALIEYEGDIENPAPALTECVRQIKKLA